jgi:hypothetical protein
MIEKEPLVPKFCPSCGNSLQAQVCPNRECGNFGIKINVLLNQKELDLGTNDTDFTLTNRQFDLLVAQMTKDQKSAYWKELQETSRRQLSYLSEAVIVLANIERNLRNINLTPADRKQTLNRLNKIASLIETRAGFACLMNQKATNVVLALNNLEAAGEKLRADQRLYQAIKDQENKPD